MYVVVYLMGRRRPSHTADASNVHRQFLVYFVCYQPRACVIYTRIWSRVQLCVSVILLLLIDWQWQVEIVMVCLDVASQHNHLEFRRCWLLTSFYYSSYDANFQRNWLVSGSLFDSVSFSVSLALCRWCVCRSASDSIYLNWHINYAFIYQCHGCVCVAYAIFRHEAHMRAHTHIHSHWMRLMEKNPLQFIRMGYDDPMTPT